MHEHTFEAGVCTQCGAIEAEVNKAPEGGGESPAPAEGEQADEAPAV